jgi:hypothetical protein
MQEILIRLVAVGVIKSVEKSDKGEYLSNPFCERWLMQLRSWQGHQVCPDREAPFSFSICF